jgi:hypothetical protein
MCDGSAVLVLLPGLVPGLQNSVCARVCVVCVIYDHISNISPFIGQIYRTIYRNSVLPAQRTQKHQVFWFGLPPDGAMYLKIPTGT